MSRERKKKKKKKKKKREKKIYFQERQFEPWDHNFPCI